MINKKKVRFKKVIPVIQIDFYGIQQSFLTYISFLKNGLRIFTRLPFFSTIRTNEKTKEKQ